MIGLLLVGLVGAAVIALGVPLVLVSLALETCEQRVNELSGHETFPGRV